MSRRILGEHFNPRGRPKRAYSEEARRLSQHGWIRYRCSFCGRWHVAHRGR